ncbi:imidazole glycerol phosphate synthase subunit HisH [Eoetvoesiella caeni]
MVDYHAGNVKSIVNAVDSLNAISRRVSNASDLDGLTHLILPGVGAFGFCATQLRSSGLLPSLEEWALRDRKPILGICVGMQLLADIGEELGEHQGLGWGGGRVRLMTSTSPEIRVPHVGWNTVCFTEGFGEFGVGDVADFYFDHSYAYSHPTYAHQVASCLHGQTFCAVIRRDNIIAAQFHPEKSQTAGMRFLRGFFAI